MWQGLDSFSMGGAQKPRAAQLTFCGLLRKHQQKAQLQLTSQLPSQTIGALMQEFTLFPSETLRQEEIYMVNTPSLAPVMQPGTEQGSVAISRQMNEQIGVHARSLSQDLSAKLSFVASSSSGLCFERYCGLAQSLYHTHPVPIQPTEPFSS